MIILYPANGLAQDAICVVHPILDCGLTIEDIARKDVPQGAPYRIVDAADLPTDRTFRAAWEADFSEPDGFGDPDGWWSEQAEREEAEEAARIALAGAPAADDKELPE